VYKQNDKKWHIRKNKFYTIGQVHYVTPAVGDLYYMRMLLHNNHCRGKISFIDLKTIDGVVCETYQQVCNRLGLLEDDSEWIDALEDATHMCLQLQRLFVMILIFCNPEGPRALFDRFWIIWYDDFSYKAQLRNIQLQESQLKTLVLQDIELNLSGFDNTLIEYKLPEITLDDMTHSQTFNQQL
jgi:hypothetical protein